MDVTFGPTERSFVISALAGFIFVIGMVTGTALGRPYWAMKRTASPSFFWPMQAFWVVVAIGFAALGIWALI